MMIGGVILLGLGALMLYSGFTGLSAFAEIGKLLAGEPAFSTKGQSIKTAVIEKKERFTGGGVRTGTVETIPAMTIPAPIPDRNVSGQR